AGVICGPAYDSTRAGEGAMKWMTTKLHARLAALSLLVCAVGMAACDDSPTDDGEQLRWEAELTGAEVDGVATVLSNETAFSAAIEIANAPADATYTWRIAAGTCDEPGDPVGDTDLYPE